MKPIDLVLGTISNIEDDRRAGWQAFYRKDAECEELHIEIERLKSTIDRLRKKK